MPISKFYDLASGIGGKMNNKEVDSAVKNYLKYHTEKEFDNDAREEKNMEMVIQYYDLVTSFYEFGWGESFHFAPRMKGETFKESIKRHQHFLALQLGFKEGMKVLDAGCGIGGPMREIAGFSLVSVIGLNNSEYQISRGTVLNDLAGMKKSCNFILGSFMEIPFPDNSFDAVYAIEAICHAHDVVGCYQEIYRVLKPGQCFGTYEWCLTENYNPNNESHKKIKADIMFGTGLPDLRTIQQNRDALKQVGFELVWEKDLATISPIPWYFPLDAGFFSLSGFSFTAVGRLLTRMVVKTLELVRLAPPGSYKVNSFLETSMFGILSGARKEIFTPMNLFIVRKPL